MVMYVNEVETKEKQKLPKIKNQLQHIHNFVNHDISSHTTVISIFEHVSYYNTV